MLHIYIYIMPNFSSRDEAIQFYRGEEEALKDMPDYLIGCLIDFSRKYENYDEYAIVEAKVLGSKPLTKKEQKKYGHLTFDKKVHVTHPKNAVLHDMISTQHKGDFDDLSIKENFDKMNKYGLNFAEKQEPPESVKFKFTDEITKEECIVEKKLKDIHDNPSDTFKQGTWDISDVPKKIEE